MEWRSRKRRQTKGVEWLGAFTAREKGPGSKILHRQAKGVKLHRTRVISGKLANKKNTLNDVGGNKNISEAEGAGKDRITY